MKSGYLYTGGLYSADARRNKWVRFLRTFRKYVSKTYNFPNRRKIAKEIYNELKKSGQLEMLMKHHQLPPEIRAKLDQLLTIKPKTGLELALSSKRKRMEFPYIFTRKYSPMEFPPLGIPHSGEMEFPYIGLPEAAPESGPPPLPPRLGIEFPHIGLSEIAPAPYEGVQAVIPPPSLQLPPESEQRQEQAIQAQVAHENIAEAVDKALKEMPPGFPEETKQVVAQNIQEAQKELGSQGNLATTDPYLVKGTVADAVVGASKEKEDVVSQAAAQITGVQRQEVKQEIQ
jgi:hypothetical protein